MFLQLSSLYENKPPVSRAKMAAITKSALKAIKFYKHVVQSVERFIQKVRIKPVFWWHVLEIGMTEARKRALYIEHSTKGYFLGPKI